MDNVKQMLTVLEQGPPAGVPVSVRTLARIAFQTTPAGTAGVTTRVTAMFVGEFLGPSGISQLEFILDNELLEPTFDTTTTRDSDATIDPTSLNVDRRSVTCVAFKTGVPSGGHELTVRHRVVRPPKATIGPRTLTIWETVVQQELASGGGTVIAPTRPT